MAAGLEAESLHLYIQGNGDRMEMTRYRNGSSIAI